MATYDFLEITIDKVSDTYCVKRGFSTKEINGKLTREIIQRISKIIHNKNKGYDVFYTNINPLGNIEISYYFESKFSKYKKVLK